MGYYERHKQVAREQERQMFQNCALLCAYVYGQSGGWYMVASGHVDGFRSDYALVQSCAGNIACHQVRALYAATAQELSEYAEEIGDICDAVTEARGGMEYRPLVAVLTAEEIERARQAVAEALAEGDTGDIVGRLRELCAGVSDLGLCDWEAVAAALERA